MLASTAIYRSIIKPSIIGAIVCFLAWIAMRVFGVTQVFGWDIKLGWIFFGTMVLVNVLGGATAKKTDQQAGT